MAFLPLHVERLSREPVAGTPAWMFDHSRCFASPMLTASPFVSMDALSVRSDLLRQALKSPLTSSNAPSARRDWAAAPRRWGSAPPRPISSS